MTDYFHADAGAKYHLDDHDGVLVATADRTRTVYTSPDTHLKVTGMKKWHACIGTGNRAVLFLDNGEGISRIPGVVRSDTPTDVLKSRNRK